MSASDKVRGAIAETWERFKGRIFERVETLEAAAAAAAQDALTPQARQNAVQAAHKLAGTLGTFGFHEGTRLAREIELLLQSSSPLDANQRSHLGELVLALRRELDRRPSQAPPV